MLQRKPFFTQQSGFSWDEILRELRLKRITLVNGNGCKSESHCAKKKYRMETQVLRRGKILKPWAEGCWDCKLASRRFWQGTKEEIHRCDMELICVKNKTQRWRWSARKHPEGKYTKLHGGTTRGAAERLWRVVTRCRWQKNKNRSHLRCVNSHSLHQQKVYDCSGNDSRSVSWCMREGWEAFRKRILGELTNVEIRTAGRCQKSGCTALFRLTRPNPSSTFSRQAPGFRWCARLSNVTGFFEKVKTNTLERKWDESSIPFQRRLNTWKVRDGGMKWTVVLFFPLWLKNEHMHGVSATLRSQNH